MNLFHTWTLHDQTEVFPTLFPTGISSPTFYIGKSFVKDQRISQFLLCFRSVFSVWFDYLHEEIAHSPYSEKFVSLRGTRTSSVMNGCPNSPPTPLDLFLFLRTRTAICPIPTNHPANPFLRRNTKTEWMSLLLLLRPCFHSETKAARDLVLE